MHSDSDRVALHVGCNPRVHCETPRTRCNRFETEELEECAILFLAVFGKLSKEQSFLPFSAVFRQNDSARTNEKDVGRANGNPEGW